MAFSSVLLFLILGFAVLPSPSRSDSIPGSPFPRGCTDPDVLDAAEFAVSLWNDDKVSKWEFLQTLNDDDPVVPVNNVKSKKAQKTKNGKGKKAGKGKKGGPGNSKPPVFYTSFEVVEASAQVVAGLNYMLVIGVFNDKDCAGGLNVTVYQDLDGKYTVTDWGDIIACGGLATVSCDIIEMKVNTCNQP